MRRLTPAVGNGCFRPALRTRVGEPVARRAWRVAPV